MSNHSFELLCYSTAVVLAGMLLIGSLGHRTEFQARKTLPQERIDATSRTPVGMVVNWARTVLASERDPKSVVWEQLLASQDGSVVCLAYRSGGGVGAVSRRVAFVVEAMGAKRADWDNRCNQGVLQVADARQWIAAR